jgi:hypothetical protein
VTPQTTETRTARYLVTFDRIGRHHDVPPLNTEARNAEDLATTIYSYARPYLASRGVEVYLDLDEGHGGILCGFHSGGRFTILDREPWRRRCAQPRNTFQHGTRVAHRDRTRADWRGIVTPDATGKYMRLSAPFDGDVEVHVAWGTSFGPATGWHDVTELAAASLSDAEVFVARGWALMDRREPGWRSLVDPDVLDMASPYLCVLGQTWTGSCASGEPPYEAHCRALFPNDKDGSQARAHGFDTDLTGPQPSELTAEWERVILTSREAATR